MLWDDLIAASQYTKAAFEKAGERIFTRVFTTGRGVTVLN